MYSSKRFRICSSIISCSILLGAPWAPEATAQSRSSVPRSSWIQRSAPETESDGRAIGDGDSKYEMVRTENVAPDLQKIYAKTSDASTIADFTAIIEACKSVMSEDNRPADERNYARNLMSWAANRRGEARSDQAALLVDEKRLSEADKMDRLAAKDFELAIEQDPKRWRAHHNLGIVRAILGDTAKAIACCDRVIAINPNFADAYINRAELLTRENKFTNAIDDYSKAIDLEPTDASLHSSRGHAYFANGKTKEALADYAKAVELAPESADLIVEYADTCQSLGRWQKAAESYQKAIKLEPTNTRALQNAAWMMATCPDEYYRNPKMALKTAERAAESVDSPNAHLLDVLAATQAANGDFQSALSTLKVAIQSTKDASFKNEMMVRRNMYQRKRAFLQSSTRDESIEPSERSSDVQTASATTPVKSKRKR